MISVCKSYTFSAAHRLPNHKGLCANLHGHNYKLEVCFTIAPTIKSSKRRDMAFHGLIDNEKASDFGMIVDFGDIDEILNPILEKFDHKDLSYLDRVSTCEVLLLNIKMHMEDELAIYDPALVIHNIKLWESDRSYAMWEE